jgi:hypothetical protein
MRCVLYRKLDSIGPDHRLEGLPRVGGSEDIPPGQELRFALARCTLSRRLPSTYHYR